MPSRSERLLKLQRMLGQIREIEELRQARLERVARDLSDRRQQLLTAVGQSERLGVGLSQSFAGQSIRKAQEQAIVDQNVQRQRERVLLVARREAAAERIADDAAAEARAVADEESLADILERVAVSGAAEPYTRLR